MSTAAKSIFGAYTDKLQLIIDSRLDAFAPTWFEQYFDWAPAQASLTYVSAIGRSRIEAAASVVDRDSKTPLRARPALEKLSGEIPAIKEAMKMSESDYREFITMQNLPGVDDASKKDQLLAFMFDDVKRVGDSTSKRIDFMALQAVSTGQIDMSATNNPDGIAAGTIDLLMPSANKSNAATTWANVAANPLTVDIPTIIKAGRAKGNRYSKILMTPDLFWKFAAITEVKNLLSNFVGFKQAGNILPTLDNINSFMTANSYPVIELVDEYIGIEKDGVITASNPFASTAAVFVPQGKLGSIKNAIPIERIRPVDKVNYANFNKTLISKWSENEPFGEWTKAELNAFPAFESIDSTYILTATF